MNNVQWFFAMLENGYRVRNVKWELGEYVYNDENGLLRDEHDNAIILEFVNINEKYELWSES